MISDLPTENAECRRDLEKILILPLVGIVYCEEYDGI